MRAVTWLALALGGCVAAPAPPPARVMSINLCTDQLLLALLPPERIASVTWLARDPAYSAFADAARRVPVNRGTAEEVMAAAPALVLTGEFSAPTTRALLVKTGYRLVEIPPADDFAGVRAVTRQVGAAVGAEARAGALIAEMDAELAKLAASPPDDSPRLLAWSGDGTAPGAGTLHDAVVRAAGARNVAAEAGAGRYVRYDVEALLAADPDVLIRQKPVLDQPDRRDEAAAHPVVRRRWAGHQISTALALGCGTPRAADAARALRTALAGTAR